MFERSSTRLVEVRRLYDSAGIDVDFASVIASADVGDDMVLAELIEADGRLRLLRNRPVDLARYLSAIPDLARRADPLDAAIDVSLRQLSGGARTRPDAVERMIAEYPELEQPILEAAALNAAVWSTTGLRSQMAPVPPKSLPCDFGAMINSGEQRYQLQKLLGQGAFGQVYLALDRQLSEEGHTAMVAIKVLAARDRSPWARQQMIEEATKVRRISHPNVVQVMDRGVTEDNEDYIVYELVDGGDMSDQLSQTAQLPIVDAVRLVRQIALGIHAAHSAGVIHCDLKPGNIMLTKKGVPKVGDFGIAVRLSDHTSAKGGAGSEGGSSGPIGNLAFVSPEQYRGEEGARSIPSDIYSLGGILFVCLTGVLPNGSTLEEIACTHDTEQGRTEPPHPRTLRPEVDRDLDAICRRALAIKPQDRYSSAAAMAEDLERWLKREPIAWTRPSKLRVVRLWSIRKPALAASVAAIIVLAVAGSIVALRLNARANQKAIEAAEAKVKFKMEEQFRKAGEALLTSFKSAFKDSNPDYRFSTEALAYIWVFEYFFGPKLFGIAEAEFVLWKTRIEQVRQLREIAIAKGGPEQLETLMWESALAFFLVCDGDYLEAEPMLRQNIAAWERKLSSDDSWLVNMRTIQLCARVNRHAALAQPDHAELLALEQQLNDAAEDVGARLAGTPIHFQVMKSLASLYGPKLLDDPQRHQSISDDLTRLINETKFKLRTSEKK